MEVEFKSNLNKVLAKYKGNKKRALTAMGLKGVEVVVDQMQKGYGKPIRQSGDLMRDVNSKATETNVKIGNSLEYAPWVHEGTRRMAGRPYLRDGLTKGEDELKATLADYLGDGMD